MITGYDNAQFAYDSAEPPEPFCYPWGGDDDCDDTGDDYDAKTPPQSWRSTTANKKTTYPYHTTKIKKIKEGNAGDNESQNSRPR